MPAHFSLVPGSMHSVMGLFQALLMDLGRTARVKGNLPCLLGLGECSLPLFIFDPYLMQVKQNQKNHVESKAFFFWSPP